MNARTCLLFAMLCCHCGGPGLPTPQVLSISPASMIDAEGAEVVITASAIAHHEINYGTGLAAVDPSLSLAIGELLLADTLQPNGRFQVSVPTLLGPGRYDVSLAFPDGRKGVLPSAFEVRPGGWPARYVVEPVGPQRQGIPFAVTFRAEGAAAATFRGNVTIATNRGEVSPALSGAFSAGVRVETVVIGTRAQGVTLTVRDIQGGTGTSNRFDVD